MIPHEAIVPISSSVSNHRDTKSTALIVISWTNATRSSGGSARNERHSGRSGSHCRGSSRSGSGGTTPMIGLMNRTMSVGSPFHPRTAALNRKLAWEEWQGTYAASVFADFHDIEYNAIREAVAAIDVSPLFKYLVRGPDAVRLVDRVITRDATKIRVGRVVYTPWCDERGKVIDDGTVSRLDETTFRWTAAEPNLRWLELNATGLDVEVEDLTDELAALAIQGPHASRLLEDATGEDWTDVPYFGCRPATNAGVDIHLTRTGYTGDLGYELWIQADRAVEVWDAVFELGEPHAIRPVGMRAMDVARVEAGLILIDAEYTGSRRAVSAEEEYSPGQLGMDRLGELGKGGIAGAA